NGFVKDTDTALARVPRRLVPGPIDFRSHLHKLSDEDRARLLQQDHRIAPTLALYWADGRRSLADIARCVGLETGQTVKADKIAELFDGLVKMGLVEL
ncbi:MAG: hypothetical protein KIT87_25000, partial [Anaerolineae bacterium]|nr:hypothetical protein [Anaerolineae bacterium]